MFFIGNYLDHKPKGELTLKARKISGLPPKSCWVTYGLQDLTPDKFLRVVQKIIDGEYVLLKPQPSDFGNLEETEEYFLTEI
jgi:hypothetical protein